MWLTFEHAAKLGWVAYGELGGRRSKGKKELEQNIMPRHAYA